MPATPSPSLSSRVRNAAVVVALVAVGLAARTGDQPPAPAAAAPATPAAQPPVAPVTPDSLAVADSLTDSAAVMVADSMALTDSMAVAAAPAPAPAPVAPATWPVDPVTGQTLINGRPVVGRVFIMQKTDGTVKYPNVADVIAHEALAPLPAVAATSYTPAPLPHTRRMRGIMIQATLWDMDTKRSATERRHYRASTGVR